jgi:fatty-acyl-CoA synthase/long-chain acyl-CoA synthetase
MDEFGYGVHSMRDLFDKALHLYADRPALTVGEQTATYRQLAVRAERAAGHLQAAGVAPGDRVALLMSNSIEFAVLDLAITKCGAAKVPINDKLATGQIAHIVNHSGARVLAVSDDLRLLAETARAEFSHDPAILSAEEIGGDAAAPFPKFTPPEIGPDGIAAIFYTGGTTGVPKGVVHLQRSLVANVYAQFIEGEIGTDERVLITTSMVHAGGSFLQAALVRGAHTFAMPFDPADVLECIEANRITWTFAVPTMIYRLLDSPDLTKRDVSSIRTIVYGAAPITAQRLSAALTAFGPVFVQLYGQSEAPNWGTRLSKEDHVAGGDILTSCGRATLMTEIMVVDDSGDPLATGEVGEVCIKAPYTLARYHENPEATRNKFVGTWIRTGDVGSIDDNGYVYLKDRTADMIISGGMNVYSAEVENVLQRCPGVAQVAVIGVPHPDWGEAVHAVVVRSDASTTAREVIDFARGQLADYQRPKDVSFVDDIPTTPYGKVDKKRIRAHFWQGEERAIH